MDLTTYDDAIMRIKIQFLYNVISRKASSLYPKSLTIMFFKAYLTMKLMNNKHLTLTTITNI